MVDVSVSRSLAEQLATSQAEAEAKAALALVLCTGTPFSPSLLTAFMECLGNRW